MRERLKQFTVRIMVQSQDVAYQDFEARDVYGAIEQAAKVALAKDLSHIRSGLPWNLDE